MNTNQQAQYEARANVIKAMAHPSRLFIIEELQKKERSVGELTEMIGSDVSTVSKHLSILKNAGLVSYDKKGTTVFYSLNCPCILDFIGCIEEVLETNAQNQIHIVNCCRGK